MPNRPDLAIRCLDALTTPNKGRVKVVREALSAGLLNDPKFAVPLVGALSDRSGVFADTLADEILPEVGVTLLDPLRDGFDELPEPVRFRHLRVIHSWPCSGSGQRVRPAVGPGQTCHAFHRVPQDSGRIRTRCGTSGLVGCQGFESGRPGARSILSCLSIVGGNRDH